MKNYIVFLAIIASLLAYIGVALFVSQQKRSRAKLHIIGAASADEYYLAPNSIDSAQYSGSQTAYQLQMQTVYPFFVLAFTGLWWIPLINLAFYIIGIIAYAALIPYFSRGIAPIIGTSRTMHAAISNLNASPALRVICALLTIVAFLGLAMFEISWGVSAIRILFDGSDLLYYISIVTLTTYLVIYTWTGGQDATIKVDQILLLFSYMGLHALIYWIVVHNGVNISTIPFQIISTIIVILSAIMIIVRFVQIALQFRSVFMTAREQVNVRGNSMARVMLALNCLTILSVVAMLAGIMRDPAKIAFSIKATDVASAISSDQFWLIAGSVACLPLFFQFVDMTDWQRTAAVRAPASQRVREVRNGLLQYLLESPLSWLLPLFAGLCAAQFLVVKAADDPWQMLLGELLKSPGEFGLVVAIFVFVGVVAIFMSTANELLTAIGLAFSYDVWKSTRRLSDEYHIANDAERAKLRMLRAQGKIKNTGRIAFATASALVVAIFILMDMRVPGGGQKFISIFLAFYTPLVAMAPSLIVPTIFRVRASKLAVYGSLLAGSGLGLGFGIWAVVDPTALNGAVQWLAAPASFVSAWSIYLVGLLWGEPVSAATLPNSAQARDAVDG